MLASAPPLRQLFVGRTDRGGGRYQLKVRCTHARARMDGVGWARRSTSTHDVVAARRLHRAHIGVFPPYDVD
jgi:hypothetical protein